MSLVERYCNGFDTSAIFYEYYRGHSSEGNEKYFLQIEQWMNFAQGKNLPLVVTSQGSGKKSLLAKWVEFHREKVSSRDLVLTHFATYGGLNTDIVFFIYKILVSLREAFNISQKVELEGEKLRVFFSYWLELCQARLDSPSGESEYERLVIIFDGIDLCIDPGTGEEVSFNIWLPKLPPKVKLIVTADKESKAFKYLEGLKCREIFIINDLDANSRVVASFADRPTLLSSANHGLVYSQLKQKFGNCPHFSSQMIENSLSCFLVEPAPGLCDSFKARFAVNSRLSNFSFSKEVTSIEDYLEFAINFWGRGLVSSPEVYRSCLVLLTITLKGLSIAELVEAADGDESEVRLVLLVFQQLIMKYQNYLMVKNEHFKKAVLRLYGPTPKKYHQRLAEVLARTPNSIRRLEELTFHISLCKNYFLLNETVSDVQNFLLLFTPDCKYDLCRYWQVLEENHFDPVFEYNKAVELFEQRFRPSSQDMYCIIVQISTFLKEFSDFENISTPRFKHPPIRGSVKHLEELGLLRELHSLQLLEQPFEPGVPEERPEESLDNYLYLNCDIPSNREKIEEVLLEEMKGVRPGESWQAFLRREMPRAGACTLYYYKRWIWLQFPWVCLSLKVDYSKRMQSSHLSTTQYVSVKEERYFNRQVLSVVLNAKLKKHKILTEASLPLLRKKSMASRAEIAPRGSAVLRDETKSRPDAALPPLPQPQKRKSELRERAVGFQKSYQMAVAQSRQRRSSLSRNVSLPSLVRSVHMEIESNVGLTELKRDKLRQLYDNLKYDNERLQKEFLRLSLQRECGRDQAADKELAAIRQRTLEVERRQQAMRREHEQSVQLKQRLSTLILVCNLNRIKNEEEVAKLNGLTSNLKKLIARNSADIARRRIEQEKERKGRLRKETELRKAHQDELEANSLVQKIRQSELRVRREIDQFNGRIGRPSAADKKVVQQSQKQTPPNQEAADQSKAEDQSLDKVREYLGLGKADDITANPKYREIVGLLQSKKKLQMDNFSLVVLKQDLQKQLRQKKSLMEVVIKAEAQSSYEARPEVKDEDHDFQKQARALQRKIREKRTFVGSQSQLRSKVQSSLRSCAMVLQTQVRDSQFQQQIKLLTERVRVLKGL